MFTEKNNITKLTWWIAVTGTYIFVGLQVLKLRGSTAEIIASMIICMATTLAVWYYINQKYYKKFLRELNQLKQDLNKTDDYNVYITKHEELLKNCTHPETSAILYINIATTYHHNKDYANAILTIEKIQAEKLHGLMKANYCITMVYMLFYNKQFEAAVHLLQEQQKIITKAKDNPANIHKLAIISVFTALYEKNYQLANDLLEEHKYLLCDNAEYAEDYQHLANLLKEQTILG